MQSSQVTGLAAAAPRGSVRERTVPGNSFVNGYFPRSAKIELTNNEEADYV